MLELSHFQHSHTSDFTLSTQSHTADETSQRWLEKKWTGIESGFCYGRIGFLCISISTLDSIFVHHSSLHLVNISQCCWLFLLSKHLLPRSIIMHLHFSYLNLFLSLGFSLFIVLPFFSSACGPVYFKPSKPDLPQSKVQQGEVWYILSPNCIPLTAPPYMARWFTINQASSGLAPSPLIGEGDLAEWNKLTWPTAGWWMKWPVNSLPTDLLVYISNTYPPL